MAVTGAAAPQGPVAQTIDLLGDRLTLAILREAFVDHVRRFSQWIDRTGAPPAMLTARLNALVEAGVLERQPQDGGHDRHDYLMTGLGVATWEILTSVWAWQREWSPEGLLQPELVHVDCGHRGPPAMMCLHCDRTVGPRDAQLVLDPESLVLAAHSGRRRSTRNAPSVSRVDLQFTEVMEAIGDRWSALVTGLALSGVRRFGEFQSILKISPTTLTERLGRLSDAQILARSEQDGGREYVLTPRGRGLLPIFAFLLAWTQVAHPAALPLGPKLNHRDCGSSLIPALRCRGCDARLERTAVHFEPFPFGTPLLR